jgi:hypothetical protein
MKKLSIGLQSFSKLLKENRIYIDKTDIIYQMISRGSHYFLSRPRRFGKSLLVSTLAEIFSGNRELFLGLAIDSLPYDWEKHPVVMISFASIANETPQDLENGIKLHLQKIATSYNIKINHNLNPGESLQELVIKLAEQNLVALLIDEYDYAILRHIHNEEMADAMRETLKSFYAVIKDLDPYLKFVFLTGISKFPKTSIFSGLNNLEDISLDARYNALLGYTKPEITTYFQDYLTVISQHNKYTIDELMDKIELWYDGYKFCAAQNAVKIYNPFSVLIFLSKERFSNYWFETGTPTFLINLLKHHNYPMQDFEAIEATESELGMFDIKTIPLKTLFFQTGYLSIRGYDDLTNNYILGYPNKETIDSLSSLVFSSMTSLSGAQFNTFAAKLLQIFEHTKLEELHTLLTSIFAAIPYGIHVNEEKYYQTIFYLILKMINAHIIVEHQTNIGRIDAILETKNNCFIIEFKINAPADKAIEQIKKKQYYQQYQSLDKKITLVGIAFDTKTKNVSEIKYLILT